MVGVDVAPIQGIGIAVRFFFASILDDLQLPRFHLDRVTTPIDPCLKVLDLEIELGDISIAGFPLLDLGVCRGEVLGEFVLRGNGNLEFQLAGGEFQLGILLDLGGECGLGRDFADEVRPFS